MTTLATEVIVAQCCKTPTVQVTDNRGQAVRSLQYNRSVASSVVATQLIIRQRYTATRRYRYERGGNLTQIRHQGSSNYTQELVVGPTSNRAVAQTGYLPGLELRLTLSVEGDMQTTADELQVIRG